MVNVVLAGGGSAGHTSPLIATAIELRDRGAQVSCVGTRGKLEERVIPEAGLELDFIPRAPFPRGLSAQAARFPLDLVRSVKAARGVLRERGADVVIGYGGYVSTPVYLAARSAKIPILIHEQNALPGMANKLGARWAARVGTTYPDTPLPGARYIGLPLRREIAKLDRAALRAEARKSLGLEGDRPTLLVSGGSLGAQSINKATQGATDALLAAGFDIVHVWGLKNFPAGAAPRTATSGARYLPLPFVDRMELAYAASDLMLGRAGSNTVNETAVIGLPQIYVPLPIGNGEQELNTRSFVDAGCGVVVPDAECTAPRLTSLVTDLLSDRARLEEMATAGRTLVPRDAAHTLADWAEEQAGGAR